MHMPAGTRDRRIRSAAHLSMGFKVEHHGHRSPAYPRIRSVLNNSGIPAQSPAWKAGNSAFARGGEGVLEVPGGQPARRPLRPQALEHVLRGGVREEPSAAGLQRLGGRADLGPRDQNPAGPGRERLRLIAITVAREAAGTPAVLVPPEAFRDVVLQALLHHALDTEPEPGGQGRGGAGAILAPQLLALLLHLLGGGYLGQTGV
jgi:hypothetical protein